MKSIKKSVLVLLSLQLIGMSVAVAKSDSSLDCLARGGCCKVGPAPIGYVYRSYGENLAKPAAAALPKTRMFDNYGVKVGIEESTPTSDPNVFSHQWTLDCGDTLKVEFTAESDFIVTMSVDATVVAAFPELAPFLNDPNAQVRIISGNHSKDDAGTVSWKGTGVFKKINYAEVRCVYLLLTENNFTRVARALGCHWFLGFKAE